MNMDLTGIYLVNEYYTNHYFTTIFPENVEGVLAAWRAKAKNSIQFRTPWARLRDTSRQYYVAHDKEQWGRSDRQVLAMIRNMADRYLAALDYPAPAPKMITAGGLSIPVYAAVTKANGTPLLWVMLAQNDAEGSGILDGHVISLSTDPGEAPVVLPQCNNEELTAQILFSMDEPPRWLMWIGLHQIVLIDRRKWNEKRYLRFELEDIFARREESTLQAMAVLLHRDSLCPEEGASLLDQLDENSRRNASGVSQDLKFALRESVEQLGNEVLYDMAHNQGRNFETDPVDAEKLTIQCMRYMYRMLFVLFIEARRELGYAPMNAQVYVKSYSLESLRDLAEAFREESSVVNEGYYLHDTLTKLFELIYKGYPEGEELQILMQSDSLNDVFVIPPLTAHIFDPELTPMITAAKLRNKVMLRILDLMSVTHSTGRRGGRRSRISYATLGINQMGAVYEALLSYRGFIAQDTLFEVKRRQADFNELDVGYFVTEDRLSDYTEEERVRYTSGEKRGELRRHEKGAFIYRLAGRERETSASYYTPEMLTKCLVKFALKELLVDKSADEILQLTICEPAMGSAAFLNEAINQLAEAYLDRKQRELGETISHEERFHKLQQVKMYLADRNVYGVDLNPVAVELAEVSLWLNTIFEGGFVPWFGTQLVCGNSLIGARRQCYTVSQLQATGSHWYESVPKRIPVGHKRKSKTQIYHFFAGDPGMANYTDRVIKALEPGAIQTIQAWRKAFVSPFSDDDIQTALKLSQVVDELWSQVVELRREITRQTSDPLTVYGQPVEDATSHTTIREKDMIYQKLYRSQEMRNAGPYARLKFAMDYWCALWFWPIQQAELLPTRSQFLSEMNFILDGTIDTFAAVSPQAQMGQLSLFSLSETERLIMALSEEFGGKGVVDIPKLCQLWPRLALVRQIAEQNQFLHWELEFADLFEQRGGFDLILGNPPWVKLTWEEKGVLSDEQPLFAVRNLTAAQTTQQRAAALAVGKTRRMYLKEYETIAAQQNYIRAVQNYPALRGLQGNLYECFLPQAWTYTNRNGVFALIHPESVFNDAKGVDIRKELNPRLRKHFRFSNAQKLFPDVHTSREFGLNVYSNRKTRFFEQIVNLYVAQTVDECYENDCAGPVYIRDAEGRRNLKGQRSRITKIGANELALFARILDHSDDWRSARLLSIYAEELLDVLLCFDRQPRKLFDLDHQLTVSMLWDETNAQKDGTIVRDVHFGPLSESILSGAHIGAGNPLFNCPNRNCSGNNDNTSIDLLQIPGDYIPRTNYSPNCRMEEYQRRIPTTSWGTKYTQEYRLVCRKMVDIEGERTLMAALIPPQMGHTNGIIGFAFSREKTLLMTLGAFCSLPYDFFIKVCGKGNLQMNTAGMLPLLDEDHPLAGEILCRAAMLNCLTEHYRDFWSRIFQADFQAVRWSRGDARLDSNCFQRLSQEWKMDTPLRTAYARRQALVELDVLVAMMLGMTLEQLLSVYRIQFPTLQQHERDTYYDANGAIVYAKNNALTGVGVKRKEFEQSMKDAPAGQIFRRCVEVDILPGGPVEQVVAYTAPFNRCDREQDYKTAWDFFEQRYQVGRRDGDGQSSRLKSEEAK